MKKEWKSAATESYQDLLLKEEIRTRRLTIRNGMLIRPVPLLKESDQDTWIMPVHAISNRHGRIPHPRSLRTNRSSLVDSAYTFIRTRYPDRLFSRTNLRGLRLLTDLLGVGWVIVDEGNGPVFKLIVENGYDGSRGGKAGLGYRIYEAARAGYGGAEFGAEDPQKGCLIKIDKVTDNGTSRYRIERKDGESDINALIESMPDSEVQALCPIENVLNNVSRNDELDFLRKTIPADIFAEFSESIGI